MVCFRMVKGKRIHVCPGESPAVFLILNSSKAELQWQGKLCAKTHLSASCLTWRQPLVDHGTAPATP